MNLPQTEQPNDLQQSDSDIWLEEDFIETSTDHQDLQTSSATRLSQIEYDRMAETFHQAGYREGISEGKLVTLQAGFDEGFSQGCELGKQLGTLRGRASGLLSFLLTITNTEDDKEDPRIDRVRKLIGDLNRCDPLPECLEQTTAKLRFRPETEQLGRKEMNENLPEIKSRPEGQQLINRCELELDELLNSIGFFEAQKKVMDSTTQLENLIG
ncbi:uncharacterized protein MELLADRAFT_116531 [Melampsora larici-populina 98AG31]|uniref:Protein YAE1 n=1 Tax=Melampsora larici-populina (strain 98AG31 / pathotype 3-4-7) TaxID=747676 RepID=F4RME9_MELLP|nr:uncharacterized protein MELLADRAFT_116531 [Melampsora larici-populina 98AG31]EGG06484.1 hypothetical protein MELLADRAFT_116531 [Melampsora larici-populina 98AG31]